MEISEVWGKRTVSLILHTPKAWKFIRYRKSKEVGSSKDGGPREDNLLELSLFISFDICLTFVEMVDDEALQPWPPCPWVLGKERIDVLPR